MYCASIHKKLTSLKRPYGSYGTGGQASFPLPSLSVKGMTDPVLSLPLTRAQAHDIIRVASLRHTPNEGGSSATLERGEDATASTHCYQLDANQFTIENPKWAKSLQEKSNQIEIDLSCGSDSITCELDELLLCEPGGFFKCHDDTEKPAGLFGTLLVQLPCNFTGGHISVQYQNKKKEFDFGGEEALATFYYVAFYANCYCTIEAVTEGYRLCLMYNLFWQKSQDTIPVPPDHHLDLVAHKINTTLKKWEKHVEASDSPKMMVCILEQQCSFSDYLSFNSLEGIDKSKVEVVMKAKEGCAFDLFLTKITVSKLCGRDEYGYDEDETFEETVTVDSIVSPDGCSTKVGSMFIKDGLFYPEIDVSGLEPDAIEHGRNRMGPTVNEVYLLAALIIIPSSKIKKIALDLPDAKKPKTDQ